MLFSEWKFKGQSPNSSVIRQMMQRTAGLVQIIVILLFPVCKAFPCVVPIYQLLGHVCTLPYKC